LLGAIILGSIAGVLRHVADKEIRREERERWLWTL